MASLEAVGLRPSSDGPHEDSTSGAGRKTTRGVGQGTGPRCSWASAPLLATDGHRERAHCRRCSSLRATSGCLGEPDTLRQVRRVLVRLHELMLEAQTARGESLPKSLSALARQSSCFDAIRSFGERRIASSCPEMAGSASPKQLDSLRLRRRKGFREPMSKLTGDHRWPSGLSVRSSQLRLTSDFRSLGPNGSHRQCRLLCAPRLE